MRAWLLNVFIEYRFWVAFSVFSVVVITSLWFEILAPILQKFGIVYTLEIPSCACMGLGSPYPGNAPDEEIDLDPSFNEFSKASVIFKKPDQRTLLLKYSTDDLLYHFLKSKGKDLCLADIVGRACMHGHVVFTEEVNGESRTIEYGAPCDLATPKPFQWIMPVIEVKTCFTGSSQESVATHQPPPPPTLPP